MSLNQLDGVEGFIAGLAESGIVATRAETLVMFTLEPIDGPHAGEQLLTGVAVAELQRWPAVPPHWIHMPSTIGFARTNCQPSPAEGMTRHSRQIRDWGTDADPTLAWVSHHRGVLGEATT